MFLYSQKYLRRGGCSTPGILGVLLPRYLDQFGVLLHPHVEIDLNDYLESW